jgi:hypothetical protein
MGRNNGMNLLKNNKGFQHLPGWFAAFMFFGICAVLGLVINKRGHTYLFCSLFDLLDDSEVGKK